MKRLTQFQSTLSATGLCLLTLALTQNVRGQTSYWDPQGSDPASPYLGNMSGTWEDALWATAADGQAVTVNFVEGSVANFGVHTSTATPAYTVTANSDHTIGGIFNSINGNGPSSLTINGAGTLNISFARIFWTGFQGSTTISNVLAGTGLLVVENSGQLYLMGTNTYSGGTQLGVEGSTDKNFLGVLHYNNSNSFGTGPITMAFNNGGTLVAEGNLPITISNAVVGTNGPLFIQANAPGAVFSGPWSILRTNILKLGILTPGNPVTISGPISGTGGLEKFRPGTLTLSGVNTFTGPLFVSLGALNVSADNNLGQAPASFNASAITLSNAALNVTSGFTLNANRGITIKGTSSIDVPGGQTLAYGGVFSGGFVGMTKTGSGTLLLSGVNTTAGTNSINAGTLALTNGGTLGQFSSMYIGPGAIFDTSGTTSPSFTEKGILFSAAGTESSPAIINGPAGGTITINPQTLNLSFTPTTFNGDVSHPALIVSQSALAFSNNTLRVNIINAAATPLGPGIYLVVQVGDGTNGVLNNGLLPNLTLAVGGTGLAGTTASLFSSNGNLYLNVRPIAAFSNLTSSQTIAYGTPTITLSGTVSQSGTNYPTIGETVSVTIRGRTQLTTINDNTGDFSIVYDSSTASVGSGTISYSYAGDATLSPALNSTTSLTVTAIPLTITANNRTKVYGQTLADGGAGNTNFTAVGLVNGETVGSVFMSYPTNSGGISGAQADAPISGSPYVIKPSQATGGTFTAGNYSISYVNGMLTVYGAPAGGQRISFQAGGVPQIAFSGTPDQDYRIEAADKLANPTIWTGLSTNAAGSDGSLQYSDLDGTNHPNRFYRAVAITVPH